ncbi:MAG: Catabolite control protein A [Candidatus Erwinia impunctatus]|nr:Catabolite control protein A [Culicoides impunctatus]
MAKYPHGRVTRNDVAREAGTSVAVVSYVINISYVINNGPRPVAEATRRRVEEAIEKTGYRPNSLARALASGRTKTFGLIVPNISNPFIASFAHALQQEALSNGMVMLLGDSGDSRQRELELIHSLLSQQVDGLLYNSVDRHPYIEVIQNSGTPFVMLERVESGVAVNLLGVDECAAARQVTEHLLHHGYQDIGIISGPLHMLNAQDRLRGWQQAMSDFSLQQRPEWIYPAAFTREGGYQATKLMLQQAQIPRALFIANEHQAIGCIRALSESNMTVPGDIALVCFNGTDHGAFHVPALTSVRQPVYDMARKALKILTHPNHQPSVVEFSHQLEIGESCGCLWDDDRRQKENDEKNHY